MDTDDILIEELLALAADGDQPALGELYDIVAPELYGVCFFMLQQAPAASAAFSTAWELIQINLSDRPAKGRDWMRAIARNTALNARRTRKGRNRPTGTLMAMPSVPPVVMSVLPEYPVGEVLKIVEPVRAQAIQRIWLSGTTYEDLGHYLNAPSAQVREWVREVLPMLRRPVAQLLASPAK